MSEGINGRIRNRESPLWLVGGKNVRNKSGHSHVIGIDKVIDLIIHLHTVIYIVFMYVYGML